MIDPESLRVARFRCGGLELVLDPPSRSDEGEGHLREKQAVRLVTAMLACFSKLYFPPDRNRQPATQNIPYTSLHTRRVRFLQALTLDYEEIERGIEKHE